VKVPDLLANAVTRFPDRACLIQDDRSLTFAEVDARADRLAQAFAESALEPGDRVALLSLSEIEYLEIQVAAQRAGVVLVPLNFRLAQPELAAIVADCEPRLLVHGPGYAESAAALDRPLTWHLGSDGAGEPYDAVLERFDPTGDRAFLESAATCTILYTSGTTGRSKGAVTSNGAIWARVNLYALEHGIRAGCTFLFPIPMFHVSSSLAYTFTYSGSTVVQMRAFDVAEAVSLLERHRVTHAVFVPTMIGRVIEHLIAQPADLGALELIIYGGSAISPEVLRRGMATLGCDFAQGYGLTEAVNATMLRREEHDPDGRPELLTSAGKATISYDVRIFGPDDTELPPGEVGELVVSGPGVMDGYWNSPEDTAQAVRGGWLHTGDLGYRSEDGFLYITDRLKDVIVSGGENVYTREVEDAVHDHEAVLEVAVIGIPSPQWGEAVHAVVVLREGAELAPDELIAHCRERLAAYKAPKSVEFVHDLPKTASGKIMKREVRAAYWRGTDRAVG
jgi:acyl-CoA synthetase (AMP-forming)/AMP-acid ligase II